MPGFSYHSMNAIDVSSPTCPDAVCETFRAVRSFYQPAKVFGQLIRLPADDRYSWVAVGDNGAVGEDTRSVRETGVADLGQRIRARSGCSFNPRLRRHAIPDRQSDPQIRGAPLPPSPR
jgi:predicted transcriptional regulator